MTPDTRRPAVVRRGRARRAPLKNAYAQLRAPLERSTNATPSRHKPTPTVNLTLLDATLTTSAANTVNKGLTKTLKPVDATFTKYQGGGR